MALDETYEQIVAGKGISSDFYLLTAVDILNNAPYTRQEFQDCKDMKQTALGYLRIKAARGDMEAKIKLSTILFDNDDQKHEAEIWSRSIFDRRLSAVLGTCMRQLLETNAQASTGRNLFGIVLEQADQGVAMMCHLVGLVLLGGVGVERDPERGAMYLRKAAEAGHDAARVELAALLGDAFKYPDLYDMDQSVALYEQTVQLAASENRRRLTPADAKAYCDLACLYYEGSATVARDLDKAYQYARKVAEATGEVYCQYIVGDILLSKNDAKQAVFWLTQSGEQGFPLAIEALSRIYFEGFGAVKKDYEQAHEWCLKGDDIWPSGLGYCQSCLGDMYRTGQGVPKDLVRSFEYYQKAASQLDAPQNYARYMLGEMFFKGEGWPQNNTLALEYYKLAAAEDYKPARERLLELTKLEEQQRAAESHASKTRARKPWRFFSLFGRQKVPTATQ